MTQLRQGQQPHDQDNDLNNHNSGLFGEIVNNHPDLICEWHPDGTLIFANQAYCQYFSSNLEELIGKSCLDYVHPDDLEKFYAHLSRLGKETNQAVIELKIINPQGKVRWQQWIDKVIIDETTQRPKLLSTGRDVTELKQAKLELINRIAFEHLITDLSINFINIPPDDFDSHINLVLLEIGRFAQVDRSYVFILDPVAQTISNTHEWCDKGISPQAQNLQDIPIDTIPWLMAKLQAFETIHIPDITSLANEASTEKNILLAQNIKSLLIVPLFNSGTLLGFIGFDSVRSHKSWSEDEATILRIVGSSIASGIIQTEHTLALAQQKTDLEKLNKITAASLNAKDVQEMLATVTELVQNLAGAMHCSVHLWNEHQKTCQLASCYGTPWDLVEQIIPNEGENTIVETILLKNENLCLKDLHNTRKLTKEKSIGSKLSILGIPVKANNTKLGVLILAFDMVNTLTDHKIGLTNQAASQIAQAILKMRLLEQAQRSAQEAETLHRAGTIVASALEPEVAIEFILDQLSRVVPFDSASIQLLKNGYLEIKAGKGWPAGADPIGIRFPVPGNNPNTKVIQTRKPCILNDASAQYSDFAKSPHSIIRSWMGVPLVVHNRVIGMLTLDHHQQNFYDEQKRIKLVMAFADQVAISLENARMYAEERQRVLELDALRATTADITQELGLKNLLTAILERATGLLNANGGELSLMDENDGKLRILVSHKMGADNTNQTIDVGKGLMGYVAQTKKIEMIEDYQHWEGRLATYKESKIHAAIAAPLMIGGRFLGVIGIMNSDKKQKFSESDYSLMNLFAQQAAIAVENAKLYEESKRQARIDLTTNIFNRRGLFELGEREFDRSKRYERPLAALMLDIDHFKIVNDTHGHPTGDLVLKEIALRIQSNLRTIDIPGRYGGEEFVILLPETTLESAENVAERLRKSIADEVFLKDSLALQLTISIGVAVSHGEVANFKTLIKHADEAMYLSKENGRNRVSRCTHNL
jgi:diguanylate cyclase (GGDEF)-like protein/PAS domain S-box-containing protein